MSDIAEFGAKAIIDAIERLAVQPPIKHEILDTLPTQESPILLALPDGVTLHDVTDKVAALRANPLAIRTKAPLLSIASVIAYLNRFKTADSAVFADDAPAAPSILGVVDFHGVGPSAQPRHGRHRVTYAFPVSDQIKAWKAKSGILMDQGDFATFLQDRVFDIANPPLDWMQLEPKELDLILRLLNLVDDRGEVDDGAATNEPDEETGDERYISRSALYKLRRLRFGSAERITQLARTVQIAVNSSAKNGYNPKTGERTLEFTEEHDSRDKTGRKVSVPDMFLLNVPIFQGEKPTLIPVRLQYRMAGASVKWAVTLIEWERVVRLAVADEAARVAAETDLPVFYGRPE